LIGQARDLSEGEPLHPGHAFVRAAVEEARQATSQPFAVELRPGIAGLPECLHPFVGKRGRLVMTKVAFRGFEPVDHLLLTALIEDQEMPLDRSTVAALLALSPGDVGRATIAPAIEDAAIDEAVEEAVLLDQTATTVEDEARFERKLEQLDRYLDDQVLVLKRRQAGLQRKLEEADRRKGTATSPSVLAKEDRVSKGLFDELGRVGERVRLLRDGEDPDYQQWRARLYERRFQRPIIERLLQVDFQVAGVP
jgi:hypothetical protein